MAAKSRKLTFPGAYGDHLAARLELPDDGEPLAYALFAHCFTCGKDVVAATRIARGLAARGYGVLRFDFTGLGESGGDFAHTHFSSNVDDLVLAADHLRSEYAAPTLLVGHSLGGAAVLAAAHRVPETRAVVTLAAPADPSNVERHLTAAALEEIRSTGEAEVQLAGRPFRIRREFLDDIADQPQHAHIEELGIPLLVMHSPQDEVVDIDQSRRIFVTARHPKSFVSLDGSDHLLTDRADADWVAELLAAWASRYLAHPAST
ncbi:alpha/beta fold hydrolase [Streptomyces sp. ACA25]|uniref:alpha/beta hydrolase family protein n=1 Tax=Streptomyces sp. ACA25 TaxID=3022596 RepID=UPI0023083665|nr:alpha/beta fold hydrolase [Streptomyces sp. ACA25]MDB1086780.1 alpha/beta fold hydrolase [Streptomyces sp. ACA25]